MIENADISHLSGFHTPARARYFFEYTGSNIAAFKTTLQFATQNVLPILTISGGKNLLLAFDEYPGLVIYNNSKGYTLEDTTVTVASGHPIWELAESLEQDHNITLWHRFLGLPGSVGGAVFGNAWCFGLEIGPYVEHVDIIDIKTGLELRKSGVELAFDYRWSECKNHPEWFLMSITCNLSELREKYPAPAEDPLAWRERVQPQGYSCGSFFKNPSREHSAWSLLEWAWLKWYHHKGTYFSEKHANFLMSDGTATWQDLIELIEIAQKKVFEQSWQHLEPEVRIISSSL